MPKVIITGTGRCGTGYAAKILTAHGLRCGHEDVFRPLVNDVNWRNYQADSSWIALAHPDYLTRHPVVHCIRNPLHVAASYLRINFFSRTHKKVTKHIREAQRLVPDICKAEISALDRFSIFYAFCMRRAMKHADITYKTESMNASVLAAIFELASINFDKSDFRVDSVPKTINTRKVGAGKVATKVTWDHLFDSLEGPFIKDIAMRYRYITKDTL